ncbi:hypothetical protein B0H14DRAFT_2642758 [Mycena olivaceomarginata]|nr:hypothetical protein B0H14DRAFT_2642758 [Mycena olivaceomarginata]
MSLRPSLLFSWVATMLASGIGIGAAGAGSGPLAPRADIPTYSWGFTGSRAGSNLAACTIIPLGVFPGSQQSTGVLPYYIMAFPVSGTPMTSLIGTDASALEWTVVFPVGTLLLLGVVDSLGTSGGGSRTQCIPSDSRPAFTITSNLNSGSTLSTCDGWQLSIQGGTPPYKVTLAPSNSADVVNVTLGPNDSVFNYLNQSPPGSQLLAAISDSQTCRSLAGSGWVWLADQTDRVLPWPYCLNEWLKRHDVQWAIQQLRSSHEFQPRQFAVGFLQRRTVASPGKPSRSLADLLVGQCSFWHWLPSSHAPAAGTIVGWSGAASIALHPGRADASPQFVIFRDDARWLDIGARARDAQG